MVKLKDIHLNYDTDKGTGHSYIETYDLLFEQEQHKPINFLEIGCLTCGSLKMFNEFFSQATIYGIDNWIQNTDHMGTLLQNKGINLDLIVEDINLNYDRVRLITCDSTDSEQVASNFRDIKFKFIIDDGDHRAESQLVTFKNMINYLSDDGIYVIEDVEHGDFLLDRIAKFDSSLHVEYIPFHKDRRADDALILIAKNAI